LSLFFSFVKKKLWENVRGCSWGVTVTCTQRHVLHTSPSRCEVRSR